MRLEAPIVSFGDVMIDALGPVSDFPSCSMLTGLLANALGYRREQGELLDRLQQRVIHGARLDHAGERFTEFQTAQLQHDDKGWTTRGRAQKRAGGPETYDSPHLRYRDQHADLRCTVALRLVDTLDVPTIDDIAAALDTPCRPLFVGRKSCLPSRRIVDGWVEATSMFEALLRIPMSPSHDPQRGWRRTSSVRMSSVRMSLPASEPCPVGFREYRSCERRDWVAGVHVGETITYRGEVPLEGIAADIPEVS